MTDEYACMTGLRAAGTFGIRVHVEHDHAQLLGHLASFSNMVVRPEDKGLCDGWVIADDPGDDARRFRKRLTFRFTPVSPSPSPSPYHLSLGTLASSSCNLDLTSSACILCGSGEYTAFTGPPGHHIERVQSATTPVWGWRGMRTPHWAHWAQRSTRRLGDRCRIWRGPACPRTP